MNVVSYGGGTNSTAMLIGLYERYIAVDLILFSDTGGEKPHTYEHIDVMQKWLAKHGMKPITIVRKEGITLEQDCLNRKALPSIAYGFKSCSDHFKLRPQRKYLEMTIRVLIRNLEGAQGKNLIVKTGNEPAVIVQPGACHECYVYQGVEFVARESRRKSDRREEPDRRRAITPGAKP